MNKTKIRSKKEIGESILRGLNEAKDNSECRVLNSELKEKRKDLFPRNSRKALKRAIQNLAQIISFQFSMNN